MRKFRSIKSSFAAKPVTEGAGGRLHRVFGYYEKTYTDPFLLLDNFGSDNPDDYIAGFPWHPHRGIETVTYMLEGEVDHEDSLGNKGTIHSGDVQWMTAGSGIIHQEMPKNTGKAMQGFQLWVNLPAKSKMMNPRYRDVNAKDISVFEDKDIKVKIISGAYENCTGPVKDLKVDVQYMDIEINEKTSKDIMTNPGHNVMLCIFEGTAEFGGTNLEHFGKGNLILFDEGELITVRTQESKVRFLYIGGKPLKEQIAWNGPIVMNTLEELEIAFKEYSDGTFLKV
jgi:redox-sensitive bicupin YhaK (pirin superfamily)